MTFEELVKIARDNGVVGAGGAGFPSYAKLDKRADTIVLNCAECEPLLKLHRQVLKKYAYEILSTLDTVADAVGAKNVIIGIKKSYESTINALKANMDSFKKISICYLPEVYPAGDEVILIYETTKRVVAPGKIPITVGVTVFNVETIYNLYNAIHGIPVTSKFVTVTGKVKNNKTVRVPVGMSFKDVIDLTGGITDENYAIIAGGPMTGRLADIYESVTKTTNAILVMPKEHYIINKRKANIKTDMKRAMSACCQCRMCTDLCPRNLLGHPIEPHAFMRAATSGDTKNLAPFINTMFCSSCGICEMFACGQGLSPRTLISEYKAGLKKNRVPMPDQIDIKPVSDKRDYRRISMKRLVSRLGLSEYNLPAPLDDKLQKADEVRIALSQHIGAPAKAIVKKNDKVKTGQMIGKADEDKLGTNIHCSIDGTVLDVNDKFITVRRDR